MNARSSLPGLLLAVCLAVPAGAAGPAGQSEMHRAAREDDLQSLATRLRQGADPDVLDAAGRTPLLEAIAAGRVEAARLLLEAGAQADRRTPSGRPPLIEAAEHGREELARLLMEAGADLDVTQRGWGTALEVAERMGHDALADLLRKAGARTFGKSVGDTVCVRPWKGDGYCGLVEAVSKTRYRIRVTEVVGCEKGCPARAECSADAPVGGDGGLKAGDTVDTVSWCVTHTGVRR